MEEKSIIEYKTVVLSDIHMGSKWSHTVEVTKFLSTVKAEKIILAGDIIDGWHLLRSRKRWNKLYNDFFATLLDKLLDSNVEIIYIKGNHDDFLDEAVPFTYRRFKICRDYILESLGRRYYIFHGDSFDNVTSKARWLSKLGDKLYGVMLQINRYYNDYRRRHGMEYYSISKYMKHAVKQYVSKHSGFDSKIEAIARRNGCDAVICGHIHEPEIRDINGIQYLNSGDWIESLTALVQDLSGEWKIINFTKDKK